MTKLSDATRAKLKTISTATVATALYKRGFRTQCIQDVHPLGADQPTLVGEAFTLRYMPAREDLNKLEVFRDRAHPQRKAVEDCPPGAVLVMDSRKDARAAWKQPEIRFERGYGWMFTRHIKQANEGCDFDFLETGFGAPVGEPSIY